MASSRLVEDITEAYLTCRICLQVYRDPRRLHCEHSFCAECISRHAKQTATQGDNSCVVKCPLCRAEIKLPNSSIRDFVSALPSDELLADLQTTISTHDPNDGHGLLTEKIRLIDGTDKCKQHRSGVVDRFCITHRALVCSRCEDHSSAVCHCLPVEQAHRFLKGDINKLRSRLNRQVKYIYHGRI